MELTDDQRMIRRSRRIMGGLGLVAVLAAFVALGGGLFAGRPSPYGVEVVMLVVVGLACVALLAWILRLLVGADTASLERRNEAIRLLLLLPQGLLVALMMVSLFWIVPVHPSLAACVQFGCLLGIGGLSAAASVVTRHYPVLPRDLPSSGFTEPVGSWAGWYADYDDPTVERYWDGMRWTDETRPRTLPV